MLAESLSDSITKRGFEKQAAEYGQVGYSLSKLYKSNDQIKRERLQRLTMELHDLERRKGEAEKLVCIHIHIHTYMHLYTYIHRHAYIHTPAYMKYKSNIKLQRLTMEVHH